MKTIVAIFLSFGIASIYFVWCQFFLVGVLIGGARKSTGDFISSISFFWIHGILELVTVILTASIVPFILASIVSLILKKTDITLNFKKIFNKTLILTGVLFILIFVSALLETFIAPNFIIWNR